MYRHVYFCANFMWQVVWMCVIREAAFDVSNDRTSFTLRVKQISLTAGP